MKIPDSIPHVANCSQVPMEFTNFQLEMGTTSVNGTYDNLAGFDVVEEALEIRIPWNALGFQDPSIGSVRNYLSENGSLSFTNVSSIRFEFCRNLASSTPICQNVSFNLNLSTWSSESIYRFKPSFQILQQEISLLKNVSMSCDVNYTDTCWFTTPFFCGTLEEVPTTHVSDDKNTSACGFWCIVGVSVAGGIVVISSIVGIIVGIVVFSRRNKVTRIMDATVTIEIRASTKRTDGDEEDQVHDFDYEKLMTKNKKLLPALTG
eukprot:TRINITY_DN951_c2_g1_i2.p1 TRINITY_DN951_c2_g1~~TRINITY_DN951_c2_g1_i2.p1  ORF type:complete len:270 (-),score=96.88 TRINITY_DN951_c2_g1_i2:62-850(-)